MQPDSILSGDFSEQRWVDQISKNFDDEVANNNGDVPVCVFSVPKSISQFMPEAYVPLAIALGPYHHFESHLYQMERYKVAAVKALLSPDQVLSFESLVINRLKEKNSMIRACYHKYMYLDDNTLAWIVAIDGLFLLGLFRNYCEIALLMPEKLINDGVLYRDVMVLENQIPLCLLSEIQKNLQLSILGHDGHDDRVLLSMLREFCEVHSPLKLARDFDYSAETGYLHLLDLMYHMIVENRLDKQPQEVLNRKKDEDGWEKMVKEDNLIRNLGEVMEMGPGILGDSASTEDEDDRPIKIMKNIHWEKISNLLGLKIRQVHKEEEDQLHVTEIEIPSASSLNKYGLIKFSNSTGGIRDIKFEESTSTLYLPTITLDVHSEVVLRNLIAYEVATTSSTPELALYVDLMSGIIDTEADAKLLRANRIINGNMSDKEVARLFNGMNKCNGYISSNKTIEQLNEYYNNQPKIKAWRFIKNGMLPSQKIATVVLTLLVCFLMVLYSFCEVYGCPRLFHKT